MLLLASAIANVPGLGDVTSVHLDHTIDFGPSATPSWPTPQVLPPVTNGPDLKVYGYVAYWDDDLNTVPWDQLSHLALFNADVDTAGNLSNTARWDQAAAAVAMGQPYGVDVHLAITNFNTSELETLLGNPAARANLITQLATWESTTGVAGINVDFEGMPSSRRAEMVQFVTDLDAVVGDVVLATPAVDWSNAWDEAALTDHADLFIMGYGYHWSGSAESGPTDPLYAGPGTAWSFDRSLSRTVQDYLSTGAAADRIILGLPLYGRAYYTANNNVPTDSNGDGGALFWSDAMDDMASTPGTFEPTGSSVYYYTDGQQHWTNDVDTVRERIQYAVAEGIGGIGFWALNYDDEDAALWSMVQTETTFTPADTDTDADTDSDTDADTDTDTDSDTDADTDADTDSDTDADADPSRLAADAGSPILAYTGDTVVLNGIASTGPGELTYVWTQVAGPDAELDLAEPMRPRFTVPAPGNYAFELTVGIDGATSAPAMSYVIGIDRAASRAVEAGGCGCEAGLLPSFSSLLRH